VAKGGEAVTKERVTKETGTEPGAAGVRVEYDDEVDVAYIHLVDHIGDGEAEKQIVVESDDLRAHVILDLDARGALLGIEIVGASHVLRPATLQNAPERSDWPT